MGAGFSPDTLKIKIVEENNEMPDTQSVKAQLGCGTLILIALIVFMFSGDTKVKDLRNDVQELTKQVIVLQIKVDALSKSIQTKQ